MRIRKNYVWVAVAVLVIAGGILTAILLRKRAAPDAVRLLPDCDAVLYVNLEPIRLLTDLGKSTPKEREPQYEDFVRQTGFEFERDLDKAAFAIQYGVAANGKKGETRYSEVLQGHFDRIRVANYLRQLATGVEPYEGYDVYVIPVEDRQVRVALLGVDIAAVSNTPTADALHGMIDRYRQAALPFTGPALVAQYYSHVPLGSVVWTIARPPAASTPADHDEMLLPGGWSGLLPPQSVVIASARPLNEVRLRAEVITGSEAAAENFAQQVQTYLALFKSLEISVEAGGPDKDVQAAFDSLEVHQEKNEAILTAKVPFAFFRKMLKEPPVQLAPGSSQGGEPNPANPPSSPKNSRPR